MATHGVPRVGGGHPVSAEAQSEEVKKIAEYKGLIESSKERMENEDFSLETLNIISKVLTWNPEYYTVWNYRRRILRHLLIDRPLKLSDTVGAHGKHNGPSNAELISSDLNFLVPLLRKFPKCYWIWNYRLWLLGECDIHLPKPKARDFWEQELVLASKMLSLDSRNFHGWGYRRTVINALEKPHFQLEENPDSLTQREFDYSTRMINTNLSNFSAWHSRSKLIPRLLDERQADDQARRDFLDDELELIERALWAGDHDQSIWFYHQYLMCAFDPEYCPRSMAPNLTQQDRKEYISAEIDKIVDMLDGAEDCKYIYQALIHLSMLYHSLGNSWPNQADQIHNWINALQELDPFRAGRWKDLAGKLSKT